MNNLTATIITLNEEKSIEKCLMSLSGLADEIVLVDSGSSDKTVEIAQRFRAKIFGRRFDNFASQKNFALSKASKKWILSVDADEVIPEKLAEEIEKVVENDEINGYLIPRRNFILGKEIKHSRWSPDSHIWLFKKEKGKWEGEVHEEVSVEGEVGELKNAKLHYQADSILGFIKKNNKYSSLEALKKSKLGEKFSLVRFFWEPLFEFSVRFIYKKGYLDGWRGLLLAILMAFYKFQVWVKILKLQSK